VAAAEENGIRTNERGEMVLSIETLRPKARWLQFPDPDGGTIDVKIPGSLALGDMIELRAIEQAISQPGGSDDVVIDELGKFADLLADIIGRENPDLSDDFTLDLDYVTATRLLVFLSQPNESMAMAWVDALTAGGGEKPDAASRDAHELARRAGLEDEGEEARPLRSTRRSSSRSSRSAKSTAGRPSGGSGRAARGRRSGSTSRTRSNGSASDSET
jgi:hypothetical protein